MSLLTNPILGLPLPLSTAYIDFKHDGQTYSKCPLAHRLVVEGFGDELLQRRNELSDSVLSHTCEVTEKNYKKTKKVSNFLLNQVT